MGMAGFRIAWAETRPCVACTCVCTFARDLPATRRGKRRTEDPHAPPSRTTSHQPHLVPNIGGQGWCWAVEVVVGVWWLACLLPFGLEQAHHHRLSRHPPSNATMALCTTSTSATSTTPTSALLLHQHASPQQLSGQPYCVLLPHQACSHSLGGDTCLITRTACCACSWCSRVAGRCRGLPSPGSTYSLDASIRAGTSSK